MQSCITYNSYNCTAFCIIARFATLLAEHDLWVFLTGCSSPGNVKITSPLRGVEGEGTWPWACSNSQGFSLERWLTGGKDWNGWSFHKIRTYCRFTAWLARCLGNVPHLFWKRSFHMDQLVKCINGLEERPITPRGVAGGTRTAKDLVQLRWLEHPWAFHGSLHHQDTKMRTVTGRSMEEPQSEDLWIVPIGPWF